MPPLPPALSVLLLAGGRGQRVGGQDKGLLHWHGHPLVAHLHTHVRPLTDDLLLSCNRNAEHYAAYADHLVTDDAATFEGPMAGIRAGLAKARHPLLLVLPCDVPGIDSQLLAALYQAAADHPGRPALVRQGGHWEPLLCIIPLSLRGAFERAWARGERSPRQVLLAAEPVAVDCPAADPRLGNLNTLALLGN